MAFQKSVQQVAADLSMLPMELQEEICSYLDGKSLLRACCVCWRWNSIISQLEVAWRGVCIKEGAGKVLNKNSSWKSQYQRYLRILFHLQRGDAFQYKYFKPECFCDGVDDFVYSKDVILAGVNNEVRMWRVSDLKPVGKFSVMESISVMAMSDGGNVLAVGHRDGSLSLWFIHLKLQCNEYTADMIKIFLGHSSTVISIAVDDDNDIVCSGSDQKVLVWRISSNQILNSLEVNGKLLNVSLQSEKHNTSLLILSSRSLYLYKDLQFTSLEFPMQGPVFSIRAYIQEGKLLYLCDGQTLVKISTLHKKEIWSVSFDCKTAVLIAVGSRFGLVTLWQRQQASQRLVIVDLMNGTIIAAYSLPYCREHVIVGDTAWLEGLALQRPGSFLAAAWCMGVMQHFGQVSDVLYIVKWSEDVAEQH